jgi:hypothetical protein
VKKSAKEALDAVKSMRAGNDRVKFVSLQHLLKEFENIAFHDGASVDDFTMRMNELIFSLCELSEEMLDSCIVRKILCIIPKKLRQVWVTIEMLTDLDTMTVEQLVGPLHVAEAAGAEDVANNVAVDGVGCLLLTEE